MQTLVPYQLSITSSFDENELRKGLYIVLVHATRIPPHIGIIAGNQYHSLTIKGQEINQSVAALIKSIRIRKTAAVFIKIKPHFTFSVDYLKEHFISNVQQFPKVESGKATCLTPVKLFFEEAYDISMKDVNYIFDLIPKLESLDLIENVSALFIANEKFLLPVYNEAEISKGISDAAKEAMIIKQTGLRNHNDNN